MFDLGRIDAQDPGANAERLRPLRQLQEVEKGVGSRVTGQIPGDSQG